MILPYANLTHKIITLSAKCRILVPGWFQVPVFSTRYLKAGLSFRRIVFIHRFLQFYQSFINLQDVRYHGSLQLFIFCSLLSLTNCGRLKLGYYVTHHFVERRMGFHPFRREQCETNDKLAMPIPLPVIVSVGLHAHQIYHVGIYGRYSLMI